MKDEIRRFEDDKHQDKVYLFFAFIRYLALLCGKRHSFQSLLVQLAQDFPIRKGRV